MFETKSFSLSDNFLETYKNKQPNWGPLGYITYKRTYARALPTGGTEEYWQTLNRVINGVFTIQKQWCKQLGLPWLDSKAQKTAQKMYQKMWNFKMLAPGRGLWIMGTEFIEKHGSAALNNCAFTSTEDIDIKHSKSFEFLMDMSMLGVGVGFDTLGAGKITIKDPKDNGTYAIPDSREGWVESLKKLLDSYFIGKPKYVFDYSLIRPAGAPIKGFGGVSSGFEPLKKMHENIESLLISRIGQPIKSTDIVDIMNMIGCCVVSGNVRRSASIALGYPDDTEFLTMKQDIKKLESHRWASNNSILAKMGMDYGPIVESVWKNGEPGVVWMENAQKYGRLKDGITWADKLAKGLNPCGEQTLESFELCCLVETFPSNHDSYEEYEDTLKLAYLYGKTVTLVNTHWAETNAVMLKNRRMGISQTGIINAFGKHGFNNMISWCDKGYKYLKSIDELYSSWLCVPLSKKLTTVKPSGTVSLLAGVCPGIHYPHSEYYIRRIRFNSNSEYLPFLKDAGYKIEDDVYSKNSVCVEFPIKEPFFTIGKNDISVWEQLENAAIYQNFWSDNQVSITVTFKEEEKVDLKRALNYFEHRLKSVSLLPYKDHGYKQAPYEQITEDEYNIRIKNIKPLILSNNKLSSGSGEKFCSNDSCEITFKK